MHNDVARSTLQWYYNALYLLWKGYRSKPIRTSVWAPEKETAPERELSK